MMDYQIDWNDLWKRMRDHEGGECQDHAERKKHWDSKENALNYMKGLKEHPERIEPMLQKFPLSPEFQVLDIGSGPGTMAIPMSSRVAHITAVEPGKGMMAVLQEQITEHEITNITTIKKRWEDVDIAHDLDGPYDLVIASQSLGMPDMKDAIRKMCDVSRKWVYLMWVNGIPTVEQKMIELWPALHGCKYHVGPRGNVLFNILYNMKIYPNVNPSHRAYIQHYSGLDELVNEYRKFFRISTPQQEKILKDSLSSLLEKTETGYIHRRYGNGVTFWWDVTEIDNE